jgi:hypothetical protein
MINPWFTLGVQAARLTWEAQLVIGLRLMRLAAGGPRSESEARRLVPEKIWRRLQKPEPLPRPSPLEAARATKSQKPS